MGGNTITPTSPTSPPNSLDATIVAQDGAAIGAGNLGASTALLAGLADPNSFIASVLMRESYDLDKSYLGQRLSVLKSVETLQFAKADKEKTAANQALTAAIVGFALDLAKDVVTIATSTVSFNSSMNEVGALNAQADAQDQLALDKANPSSRAGTAEKDQARIDRAAADAKGYAADANIETKVGDATADALGAVGKLLNAIYTNKSAETKAEASIIDAVVTIQKENLEVIKNAMAQLAKNQQTNNDNQHALQQAQEQMIANMVMKG